ncbi:hypothetical protein WUBG_18662, partial [Wuchereria bancrofti]
EYKIIFSSLIRFLSVTNLSANLSHGTYFMDIILVRSSITSRPGNCWRFINDGTYFTIFKCCKDTSK